MSVKRWVWRHTTINSLYLADSCAPFFVSFIVTYWCIYVLLTVQRNTWNLVWWWIILPAVKHLHLVDVATSRQLTASGRCHQAAWSWAVCWPVSLSVTIYHIVWLKFIECDFVIHSRLVCAFCKRDKSVCWDWVHTEFRIDIGIYIDFKFISRGMDFEICRVTELSSKRWFLYCPLPVLQIIVFTCKLQ